ncbi:MAG: DUF6768 family protein [Planctomycetota bacterium]
MFHQQPAKTRSPQQYDDSKEYTLRSMIADFYNRKMLSVIILLWVDFLVILALAIFSAVKFFRADQTKSQIMYAVIFICCFQLFILIKTFAWQMIHRNNIKRQIKRLQLQIAELSEAVKNK